MQRADFLRVQAEAVGLQRRVNARGHLQFAVVAPRIAFVAAIDRHAVAAGRLGGVAGHVGAAHQFADRRRVAVDGGDADAGAHVVDAALPRKAALAHRVDDLLADLFGVVDAAVLEQQRELVAAQARQQVVGAYLVADHVAKLAQQHVARAVASGVVDDLEAVQVDEAERGAVSCRRACSHASRRRFSNQARLGSPVSASCVAEWASSRCIARDVVMSWNTSTAPSTLPSLVSTGAAESCTSWRSPVRLCSTAPSCR
jgi:hypothetical protein